MAELLSRYLGRAVWPFPLLEGLIYGPTLRPDGTILARPGYDPGTGLYLDTNRVRFPGIPAHPTIDDARTALGQLQEPLQDFPFAEPWHFSAAIAAILTIACRFAIMGHVPLFAVRANTRGSGKSLLADIVSIIGTGRAAPRWPQPDNDDEERKRLLAVAMAGDPVVHIDNVVNAFGSPAMNMALTGDMVADRILGKSQIVEAPLTMVWLASGNNMLFKGDMARRVIPIDLDPKVEKPEDRTSFAINPVLPWVQQNRPRLTVAALTLVKAYFEAGSPSQGVALGSFEAWSDLIRQSLMWAGEADPCEGRKDIEATSDPEYEALAALLHAWHACYDVRPVTLHAAIQDIGLYASHEQGQPANHWNDLQEALSAYDQRYDGKTLQKRTIGKRLARITGRVIAGKRLVSPDHDRNKVALWKVELI